MSVIYFDTSGILKRYVTERGSTWVTALLTSTQAPTVLTSRLTLVEASCAFARRLRDGTLSQADQVTVLKAFEYDIQYDYSFLDVSSAVVTQARQLADRHPLRAYDAVHLATAVLANSRLLSAGKLPLTFICSDNRLLAFAQAEGLTVDNPNDHS